MDVERGRARVSAGRDLERRLPADQGREVREVRRRPVVTGGAVDLLVGLSELDVVVAGGRDDLPGGLRPDHDVHRSAATVVLAVRLGEDRLLGLARLEHVGEVVRVAFAERLPSADAAVHRNRCGVELAHVGGGPERRERRHDRGKQYRNRRDEDGAAETPAHGFPPSEVAPTLQVGRELPCSIAAPLVLGVGRLELVRQTATSRPARADS